MLLKLFELLHLRTCSLACSLSCSAYAAPSRNRRKSSDSHVVCMHQWPAAGLPCALVDSHNCLATQH